MAVAVDQCLAAHLGKRKIACVLLEEFREEENLPGELPRPFVVRKQVQQFVAEDRGATGLEHYDGSSGANLLLENNHRGFEQMFRPIEHARVIQGAPAADLGARQVDLVSGSL